MSELHKILNQARLQAETVETEMIAEQIDYDPLAKGSNPLQKIPKMLYTWKEAAWVMSLSVRTLQRCVANGELKTVHVGGATRLRREDLAKFAEDHIGQ